MSVWVAPACNLPMALHWVNISLSIVLPTVSLCILFESLLTWRFYAQLVEVLVCKVTDLRCACFSEGCIFAFYNELWLWLYLCESDSLWVILHHHLLTWLSSQCLILWKSFVSKWWTHWAISRSSQCSTTGVTKAMVCVILSGMMHIKEPLLLIGKSSLCGGSRFPLSLSE